MSMPARCASRISSPGTRAGGCILLHGLPYDAHCYDAVAPILAEAGARVIRPWLGGFGETRFRDPATPRSSRQAALGFDLLVFFRE